MHKYIRLAQVLSTIILVGAVVLTLSTWLYGYLPSVSGLVDQRHFDADFFAALAGFSLQRRFLGFLIDLPTLAILTLGWWRFQQIMNCFLRNEAFSNRVAIYFVSLSKIALAWAIWGMVERILFSVFASWHRGPGNRVLTVSWGSGDLLSVLVAVLLLILAHGIKHAAQVEEERKLTI